MSSNTPFQILQNLDDPEAFEIMRKQLIGELIRNASSNQDELRLLQFDVDRIRVSNNLPTESIQEIVAKLGPRVNALNALAKALLVNMEYNHSGLKCQVPAGHCP